jgi:hypothetical protein
MTRTEHLEWAKKRAIEYVDKGELSSAYASFVSDMGKHDGTRGHVSLAMGLQLQLMGQLETAEEMRKFINDFG